MESISKTRALCWLGSPIGVAAMVLLFAAAVYLGTYHLEHAVGLLPFGILLLCPLMHLFMHGGHGGHGGHGDEQRP